MARSQSNVIWWLRGVNNQELLSYFASLVVGHRQQSGIDESRYFAPLKADYGNSTSELIRFFSELGVIWHVSNASRYWRNAYGTSSPGWYTKPQSYASHGKEGRTKQQLAEEALLQLALTTKPEFRGAFPMGIERFVYALFKRAQEFGNLDDAIEAVNKALIVYEVQLIQDIVDGTLKIEYGVLSDRLQPLLTEADICLRKLEYGLRKLLTKTLSATHGEDWFDRSGLSAERREKIKARMKGSNPHSSPIDFSDFYDLKTIVEKNWDPVCSNVFRNRTETVVLLSLLLPLRDAKQHHRRLTRGELMLMIGALDRIIQHLCRALSGVGGVGKPEEG